MKKIFLMIAAFGVFSIQASDLKYNIGYVDGDWDLGPVSLGLSNVTLSVSYPINYIEGLSVEAGISEPVGDDKLTDGSDVVEYETSGAFLKGIYHFNETFFVNLNWHYSELKVSYDGTTAKGSDTELGYGVGMAFDVPNLDGKIIIGYEVLDTEWTTGTSDYDLSEIYLKYQF
tara:strand:+ start:217 stop:735 length:519 start_codon:yes stop_codon:yes gene_type:complete